MPWKKGWGGWHDYYWSETEIKPIFLINNNVIIAGTKEKETKKM